MIEYILLPHIAVSICQFLPSALDIRALIIALKPDTIENYTVYCTYNTHRLPESTFFAIYRYLCQRVSVSIREQSPHSAYYESVYKKYCSSCDVYIHLNNGDTSGVCTPCNNRLWCIDTIFDKILKYHSDYQCLKYIHPNVEMPKHIEYIMGGRYIYREYFDTLYRQHNTYVYTVKKYILWNQTYDQWVENIGPSNFNEMIGDIIGEKNFTVSHTRQKSTIDICKWIDSTAFKNRHIKDLLYTLDMLFKNKSFTFAIQNEDADLYISTPGLIDHFIIGRGSIENVIQLYSMDILPHTGSMKKLIFYAFHILIKPIVSNLFVDLDSSQESSVPLIDFICRLDALKRLISKFTNIINHPDFHSLDRVYTEWLRVDSAVKQRKKRQLGNPDSQHLSITNPTETLSDLENLQNVDSIGSNNVNRQRIYAAIWLDFLYAALYDIHTQRMIRPKSSLAARIFAAKLHDLSKQHNIANAYANEQIVSRIKNVNNNQKTITCNSDLSDRIIYSLEGTFLSWL